ncbi:hypothetical protein JXA85_03625, partial [Candidatus Woesearchaeota archaeon]|nr:hypothetical protein [Candidatus Woesearchaeota archaeon]
SWEIRKGLNYILFHGNDKIEQLREDKMKLLQACIHGLISTYENFIKGWKADLAQLSKDPPGGIDYNNLKEKIATMKKSQKSCLLKSQILFTPINNICFELATPKLSLVLIRSDSVEEQITMGKPVFSDF